MTDYTKIDSDELFRLYTKNHDVEIRNILIERYLYIAEIAAKKFAGRGVDYEDLFQVASLALVKAIERFEPERAVSYTHLRRKRWKRHGLFPPAGCKKDMEKDIGPGADGRGSR